MRQRISAVSGSKVTESRSTFRGHVVDWHWRLVCRRNVSFWSYAVSSEEIAKKVVKLGANFSKTNFSKNFAVDSKPLKPCHWSGQVLRVHDLQTQDFIEAFVTFALSHYFWHDFAGKGTFQGGGAMTVSSLHLGVDWHWMVEFMASHRSCLWKVYLSAALRSCVEPLSRTYVQVNRLANSHQRVDATQRFCQ